MNKIYAYFHYFGMSCFARHGKLFEKHPHIEELLDKNGFEIEHENVYYSSILKGNAETEVEMRPQNLTKGNQQYIDFVLSDNQVGGCEIHFIDDKTCYLRWIYINENITGKGIGTKCMNSLKKWTVWTGTGNAENAITKPNIPMHNTGSSPSISTNSTSSMIPAATTAETSCSAISSMSS